MNCSTCESYLDEGAECCSSCNELTPKGVENHELQSFDNMLMKLRAVMDNGDFAVDFEYATVFCNSGVERLVALIDELSCGTAVQKLEMVL